LSFKKKMCYLLRSTYEHANAGRGLKEVDTIISVFSRQSFAVVPLRYSRVRTDAITSDIYSANEVSGTASYPCSLRFVKRFTTFITIKATKTPARNDIPVSDTQLSPLMELPTVLRSTSASKSEGTLVKLL